MSDLGSNMKKALAFVKKYSGWQTFHPSEQKSINRLKALGLVEVFEPGSQFQITELGRKVAYETC